MVGAVSPDPRAVIIEDNHPNVSYTPLEAWFRDDDPVGYTGASYHLTYEYNASALFTFSGISVWLYADKNFDHGLFSVRVDGGVPALIDGQTAAHEGPMALFHSGMLEPGLHTINVTNLEGLRALGIDYFAIIPVTSPSAPAPTVTISNNDPFHPMTSHPASPQAPNFQSSSSLSAGTVAGIAVGAGALLSFLLIGLYFCYTRHYRQKQQSDDLDKAAADPWTQPPLLSLVPPSAPSFVPSDLRGRRPESFYSIQPPYTYTDQMSYIAVPRSPPPPVPRDLGGQMSMLSRSRSWFGRSSHSPSAPPTTSYNTGTWTTSS